MRFQKLEIRRKKLEVRTRKPEIRYHKSNIRKSGVVVRSQITDWCSTQEAKVESKAKKQKSNVRR